MPNQIISITMNKQLKTLTMFLKNQAWSFSVDMEIEEIEDDMHVCVGLSQTDDSVELWQAPDDYYES